MGRTNPGLSTDNQELLVAAKRYDATFEEVGWNLKSLSQDDVPDDYPAVPRVIRPVTTRTSA